MERIELKAYAKINLCLDVGGIIDGGYHEVNMILQQILLCDDVAVRWTQAGEGELTAAEETGEEAERIRIELGTNRRYLPNDRRNLAWQAAEHMARQYGGGRSGTIRIDIKKRIPVAAGLAGGSSNCAAVIHALNLLWELDLTMEQLCEAGAALGSDVPFCVMGQAAANTVLREKFAGDPLVCHCAIATGRGTKLEPIRGLVSDLVLSKPPVSVSTAEAYRGIDEEEVCERPDVAQMRGALESGDRPLIRKNMINVLENFTLKRYPIVVYTKNKIQEMCNREEVLMSGSGPTVFGLCESREAAMRACEEMKRINRESFWTRTTR